MKGGHYNDILSRTRRADSQRKAVSRPGAAGQGTLPTLLSGRKNYGSQDDRQGFRKDGLVVVESDGAVFDSFTRKVEEAYIPAFMEHFAYSSDPAVCAEIWRSVALHSRMRGHGPFRCLAASLRLVNRRCSPSVRRTVVARTIESWLSLHGEYSLRSDMEFRMQSVVKPAWEWYRSCESVIRQLPDPPVFPSATQALAELSESSTILAVSRESEAIAALLWENAGLARNCSRIAGRERGSLHAYLSNSLSGGFGSAPITVIGSCHSSLAASRSVEAFFIPIIPGKEEQSWQRILDSLKYAPGLGRLSGSGRYGAEQGGTEARKPGLLAEFLETTRPVPLR